MYRPRLEFYELPTKYNETVARLLVQSPTRMYAYWEIDENTIKKLKINHDNYTIVLKIINITMNYSSEINIEPNINSCYIDIKDVDCIYKFEVGVKYDNIYLKLTASNEVAIPKSAPEMEHEEEIVYKNYIELDKNEKFGVYRSTMKYNENNKQEYYGLTFSTEDGISSGSMYKK